MINHVKYPKFNDYVDMYYQLRKAKGMTAEEAKAIITENPVFFGALMVRNGSADGFVAGASLATSSVVRAAIHCIDIQAEAGSTVCSTFFMLNPEWRYGERGLLLFSDCGVIPDPSPRQLASVAVSTAKFLVKLTGSQPRIALLSYSTKGSAEGPAIDKIREALRLAKKINPDLLIDGEMQADAALFISFSFKGLCRSDRVGFRKLRAF